MNLKSLTDQELGLNDKNYHSMDWDHGSLIHEDGTGRYWSEPRDIDEFQSGDDSHGEENEEPELTEIVGTVIHISNSSSRSRDHTTMTISVGERRPLINLSITIKGFCWVEIGDLIRAIGDQTIDQFITHFPVTIINGHKESIVKKFIRKRTSYIKTHGFYQRYLTEHIRELAKHSDDLELENQESKLYESICEDADRSVHHLPIDSEEIYETELKSASRPFLKRWYLGQVLRRLYNLGLNKKEIFTSMMRPNRVYLTCQKNPYIIPSISITTAHLINFRYGLDLGPEVVKAGEIIRLLFDRLQRGGDLCVSLKELQEKTFYDEVRELLTEYKVILDQETNGKCFLYLDSVYQTNKTIASWVGERLRSPIRLSFDKISERAKELKSLTGKEAVSENIDLTRELVPDQRIAVWWALNMPLFAITGEAGTGKSTVLVEIIAHLTSKGETYHVATATGRAAARIKMLLTELNIPFDHERITTLHRLLYAHNLRDLEADTFLIDEASMLTSWIFSKLLHKIPWVRWAKMILIGDKNQLPPIGWGRIFLNLLNSDVVPTYNLRRNHRFSDGCLVATNARNIIRSPNGFEFTSGETFNILPLSRNQIKPFIKSWYDQNRPNVSNFRIITPYKTVAEELNCYLRDLYDDDSSNQRFMYQNRLFRVGEKVIMTMNDYNNNIMNGDEGEVISVSVNQLKVRFPNIVIDFLDKPKRKDVTSEFYEEDILENKTESSRKNNNESDNQPDRDDPSPRHSSDQSHHLDQSPDDTVPSIEELTYAYVMTVHRGQGSEWDTVFFYVPDILSNEMFLNRHLIYTAITRGCREVWVIGQWRAVERGVRKKLICPNDTLSDMIWRFNRIPEPPPRLF